eukprot:230479-Prymnesium_polylepis.1
MVPLCVETPGLLVECELLEGRFEVRSGDSADALSASTTTHCSGTLAARRASQSIGRAPAG